MMNRAWKFRGVCASSADAGCDVQQGRRHTACPLAERRRHRRGTGSAQGYCSGARSGPSPRRWLCLEQKIYSIFFLKS
jgi:hypothetical protein